MAAAWGGYPGELTKGLGSASGLHGTSVLVVGPSGAATAPVLDLLSGAGALCSAAILDSATRIEAAGDGRDFDVFVILDSVPACDAAEALAVLRRRHADTPCVAVIAGAEPGRAAALMSSGATDCVSNDEPTRLLPAVEREAAAARVRQRLRVLESTLTSQRLEAIPALLAGLLDSLSSGVAVYSGDDFRHVLVNLAHQALAPGKRMLGRTLAQVWPELPGLPAVFRRVLETGQPFHAVDSHLRIQRAADGPEEDAYLTWSLQRVRLTGEEAWSLLSISSETTERRRAETERSANLERLNLALEAAKAGWWEWDLATGENVWSRELYPLYGLDPQAGRPSYEAWRSSVHPDDVAATERAVQSAAATGNVLTAEWRVRTTEGSQRWLLSRGRPILGADGRPARYLGVVIDVTERRQAEEALRVSEEHYRTLFSRMPVGVVFQGPDGRIAAANSAAERILGLSLDQMQGRTSLDPRWRAVHEDGSPYPGDEHPAMRALASGRPVPAEVMGVYNPCEDAFRWISASAVPEFHAGEARPFRVFATFEDVTARVEATLRLRESEARLRLFVEHAPVALAMFDSQMRYLAASRRWHGDFGFEYGMLLGRSHYEVFPEIPERWKAIHRRALAGEVLRAEEDRFERGDGTEQWLRWEVRPWQRAGREVGGLVIFSEDITTRKRAEAALRASEERLRSLVEQATDAVFVHDLEGRFVEVNRRACESLGYTREELLGLSVGDVDQDCDLAAARELWAQVSVGREATLSGHHRRKDGTVFPVEHHLGLLDWGGRRHLLALVRDVTDRVAAERALREQEAALRAVLASLTEGVVFLDAAGVVRQANEAVPRILGRSLNELADPALDPRYRIVRSDGSPFPVEEQPAIVSLRTGEPVRDVEMGVPTADGELRWLLVNSQLARDEAGRPLGAVASFFDITDRRRSGQALRESAERLRAFFDSPLMGTLSADVHGRVLQANDEFLRIVGYSRDDLEHDRIRWDAITPEEFLPLDRRGIAEAKQHGACTPYEKQYLRQDGTRVWVLVGFVLIGPGREGSVAFVLDISARKQAELDWQHLNAELDARVRERTAQLEEANRELEAFAYSVSHDLRAPLRAIDGFSRLLLEEHASALDQEAARLLAVVRANTRRMAQLIDDLLEFSRAGRSELRRTAVSTRAVVLACWAELVPGGAEGPPQLVLGRLPEVQADAALVRQVCLNLLSNAVKFSARNPAPRVEVGATRRDGEEVFSVADNGVGFEQAYAEKLFGVFQRLHSANEFPGTGVGLALVERIVRRHGGRVWAEGRPGEGATFWFSLPGVVGGTDD